MVEKTLIIAHAVKMRYNNFVESFFCAFSLEVSKGFLISSSAFLSSRDTVVWPGLEIVLDHLQRVLCLLSELGVGGGEQR